MGMLLFTMSLLTTTTNFLCLHFVEQYTSVITWICPNQFIRHVNYHSRHGKLFVSFYSRIASPFLQWLFALLNQVRLLLLLPKDCLSFPSMIACLFNQWFFILLIKDYMFITLRTNCPFQMKTYCINNWLLMGIQLQVILIDWMASIEWLIKDYLSFASDYYIMFTNGNDESYWLNTS